MLLRTCGEPVCFGANAARKPATSSGEMTPDLAPLTNVLRPMQKKKKKGIRWSSVGNTSHVKESLLSVDCFEDNAPRIKV